MNHPEPRFPQDPASTWPAIHDEHRMAAPPGGARPAEDSDPGPSRQETSPWDVPDQPGPPHDDPGWGDYVPAAVGQLPGPVPPAAPAPGWHSAPAGPRRPARKSVALTALIAVAVAGAGTGAAYAAGAFRTPGAHHDTAVTHHHHAAKPAAAAAKPPALAPSQAQQVLARYLEASNNANASYNAALLHTVEGGSSYLMDIGGYRFMRGQPRKTPYAPFTMTHPAYYIPRFAGNAYPRWFAVSGTGTASTGKELGTAYLAFSKDSAAAPWKEVSEPYVLPARTPAPAIALDPGGYATAISTTGNTARLAIAPDQAPHATASSLDRLAALPGKVIKASTQTLADLGDEVFWRSGHGGQRINAADHHTVTSWPVLGLRTTTGGALLFYTLRAWLRLTPPRGTTIRSLIIPGYYHITGHAKLTAAVLGYIDQFATYIPPAGQQGSRIVADSSGITARGK